MDNIGCIGNGIADRFPGLVDRNFVELALHFGAKTLIGSLTTRHGNLTSENRIGLQPTETGLQHLENGKIHDHKEI